MKGRAKWLKKPTSVEPKKKKDEADRKIEKKDDRKEVVTKEKEIKESVMKKLVALRVEDKMTPEELDQKVAEAVAARGRKGSDQREILRTLELLTKAARLQGPRKEIPVLMHLISSMFDTQRSIDDFMDLNQWNSCHRSLSRVMSLLESHPELSLRPYGSEELADISSGALDSVNSDVIAVAGSLDSFILKLEEEYTKSLQQINPHTQVRDGNKYQNLRGVSFSAQCWYVTLQHSYPENNLVMRELRVRRLLKMRSPLSI